MIKSGDTISLSGNEYVKIDPGYYKNVTYEIGKIENGLHHTEKMTSGSVDVTHGNGARFTRNIEDTAKRMIFKQGETYVLTEETVFANGDSLPTNKISTILGQSVNVALMSALRHRRGDFEAHINGGACPAGACACHENGRNKACLTI